MDIKKLSDIHGLTVEEFSEIVGVFIITAKKDIEKIRIATDAGDADAAGEAAHSLKGAAGNLGFTEISETARTAEVDASGEELEKVKNSLPLLIEQLGDIETRFDGLV